METKDISIYIEDSDSSAKIAKAFERHFLELKFILIKLEI